MSALDGLFGLRRLLSDGSPIVGASGREIFAHTFNLLGGWTITEGRDENNKPTVELTPPAGGGGGGGHVIEDEGTPLTQRSNLNFVGVNVSVADAGGKTVVTIGAVNLASGGVTGTLPASAVGAGFVKVNGTTPLSADWAVGSKKLTGLTNGATGTQDAATVAQTEALIAASVVGPTLPIVNETTAARTLTAADAGKLIRCSVACTITINSGVFAAGDVVLIRQVGGMVTLAGTCAIQPPASKVNTTAEAGALIGVDFLTGSTAESTGALSDA
jgi:hypothetical protein